MKLIATIFIYGVAVAFAECPPECDCECACCVPPSIEAEPWPLAVLLPDVGAPNDGLAIPGWGSRKFTVTGGHLPQDKRGWLALSDPNGSPVSLLVALTGSGGSAYFSSQSPEAAGMLDDLVADGWRVIQLRWYGSWWQGVPGFDSGTAHLAQAPATALAWLAAEYGAGAPVVVVGNSGGAGQIAYALTHYGLDGVIDRAVVSGGPPFAALVGTGLGDPQWTLNSSKHKLLDKAHGYWLDGPVSTHNPTLDGVDWVARWSKECIADGAIDFSYGELDLRVIQGGLDQKHVAIGQRWLDRIMSPYTVELVPGLGHETYGSALGVGVAETHIRGQ